MKIQSIQSTIVTNNYHKQNQGTKIQENPSFKARLVSGKYLIREISETPQELKNILAKFEKMLRKETQFPSDLIRVENPSFMTKLKQKIKIKPREVPGVHDPQRDEGYCPSRTHPLPVIHYTTYEDTVSPNLELSINNKISVGFYYDNRRTEDEVAQDLFNTYKHLRYLEHYASRNEGVYKVYKSNYPGLEEGFYNRFDQPVEEIINKQGRYGYTREKVKYTYNDKTGEVVDISTESM